MGGEISKMDARQLEEMSEELEERLRRARVVRTDVVSGFFQLPIENQSLSQAFLSPWSGLNENECENCARHRDRVAELVKKLEKSEQDRAEAQSQVQALQRHINQLIQ